MAEYIEREDALSVAYKIGKREYDRGNVSNTATVMVVEDYLRAIPAADVRPVVRGKWVRNNRGNYNCSNCNGEQKDVFGFFFCPYCGAYMG